MVEVQGRQGRGVGCSGASKTPKKGRNVAEQRMWRCGWHCFACMASVLSCLCCSGSGCSSSGSGKYSGTSRQASRERILLWVGAVSLVLGVGLAFCWTHLLSLLVHSELTLSPRSTSFKIWRSTPVPLKIDFYFWNWTNPHEINDPDLVPHFVQMGPYRFRETKDKVNITWNEKNGTISFRQLRRWYFDSENSNGSLSDNITTINIIGVTAAHVVRDWYYMVRRTVSLTLGTTNQKVSITRTVGQFLFEGYEDPLITIASKVPGLSGANIPNFDRFGWFYMRNGSVDYDGLFSMDTGSLDVGHLGELMQWNYNNFTPYYESQCGDLRGSAGELWPPGRSPEDRVSLFAPDLCRSVSLDYVGTVSEAGVDGLRYEGGPLMLDNGQLDPDNECFCGGECLAGGVANVSACRYGAPAFVSFPHFYLADPAYRVAVAGMQPDAGKHAFYIALEPTYGIPLDVAARFQINLLVQRDPEIYMLSKVPERIMFPMIWFEQRASITPELATPLRLLLLFPAVLMSTAAALVVAGVGCGLAGVTLRWQRRRLRSNTLALVTSVVAKSAAQGAPSVQPLAVSETVQGDGKGAEQPLLLRFGGTGLGSGSGSSSGGTSSPILLDVIAARSLPEDSSTPEPTDASRNKGVHDVAAEEADSGPEATEDVEKEMKQERTAEGKKAAAAAAAAAAAPAPPACRPPEKP